MKKLIVFIAIFIFPFLVFAKEIEIKDINIKLSLNDDYIVLLRDNLDDNSDLKKLGISENYMKNVMELKNIYADILSKDVSYEILVVVPDVTLTFYNLSDATDSMLDDLKEELVKKTGAEGASVYKGSHNYIVIDYFDENTDYYIVNYYTVVNAKGYNIQLQKKTAITPQEKEELKNIIDSVDIEILDSNDIKTTNNNVKKDLIVLGIGVVVGITTYIITTHSKKKKSSE